MHGSNLKRKLLWTFYLVLLYLSHITGRKFTSFRFLFLVYLKIENISLYFYFLAYFSKLPFERLVTTGESTMLVSQKTTTDLLGS